MKLLTTGQPDSSIEQLTAAARDYAAAALSPATRRSYDRHWRAWCAFAAEHGEAALPASNQLAALWLASLANHGLSVSTLTQALSALAYAHETAGLTPPTGGALKAVARGARRKNARPVTQKAAISVAQLRAMVAACQPSLVGLRDRAILLLGFAGAFRRSELAGLRIEDLSFGEQGLTVQLRRSKTDQEGKGRTIGIPARLASGLDPAQAVREWLEVSRLTAGPLFRAVSPKGRVSRTAGLTGQTVAQIVKRYAELACLDPTMVGGHSLRAGLVTAAVRAGKPLDSIMRQTGHTSPQTVLGYIRKASLFEGNAASDL